VFNDAWQAGARFAGFKLQFGGRSVGHPVSSRDKTKVAGIWDDCYLSMRISETAVCAIGSYTIDLGRTSCSIVPTRL
jgi:hypothetical protein